MRFSMREFVMVMVIAVVGTVGCGPKIKPGLTVKILVEGNAAPGERAKRIDLVFDRGMVADAQLGRELSGPAIGQAPFRLEPPVAGVLRWREDRRLSFEPTQPLPRSTRFVVTIPRGTRAPDLFGLDKAVEHTFETERLAASAELERDFRRPDPKRWAVPEQQLRVRFNQPVRGKEAARHCAFRSGNESIVISAQLQGAPEPLGETFLLAPATPLARGTEWRFSCGEKLTGAEGPLPLAARQQAIPFDEANGGKPDATLGFHTFGDFTVSKVAPEGQDVDPDQGTITVTFSTPPVLEAGTPSIKIDPKPREASETPYVNGAALVIRTSAFDPHTAYTVSVPAGIKDVFGQTLAAPFSATFRTGAVTPGYGVESGSWAVESTRGVFVGWARNIKTVQVRAAAISPEELFRLLPALNWWDSEPVDLKALKIGFADKVIRHGGDANRWSQVVLDPKELLGAGASRSRFYYLASRSPEVTAGGNSDKPGQPQDFSEVLLNVTNLGITAKLSGNSGLTWVTRLSDGAPQAGAEVMVRERGGAVLWRGVTGADGLAAMPGKAELLAKAGHGRKAKKSNDEEEGGQEGEEGEGEESWGYQARLLVFARLADDITFVDPERVGGFAAWNFGVENSSFDKAEALRGFLHTDRGLYRPGDTVHLRGLARVMRKGGGLHIPATADVAVSVADPRGQVVKQLRVPLSRFGGFTLDHDLSEAATLGDYRVQATLPQGVFSETFTVEEYRPATFEVKLGAPEKELFAGRTVNLTANGRYFYGAPVRGADVTFRVHSRARDVDFEGFTEFSFADEYRGHGEVRPYGEEAFITEEARKLDGEGQAGLPVALPPDMFVSPSTVMVSATVQDETKQTVSANLTLPLHRSRYYLGIDSGGWMAPALTPHKLRFVAVNTKGKAIAAKIKATITKQNWSCVWERWGYQGSYRCDNKEEVLQTTAIPLLKDAPFEHPVTFPGPGEYVIVIEGHDADNTAIRASRSLWVWGDGDSAWRVDDSGRFDIVADKKEYRVGDTARLLIKAPLGGTTALVTIERDGILSQRVQRDLKEGQAIEVPITAAFQPNAYVSVMLARGRGDEGARGLPKITMGVVNLPVVVSDKRLRVEVATEKADYRPGAKVSATVRVTDAAGQPVRAEIALAAADEGVLSLIGFRTPDPVTTFFAPWGLGVKTTSQYERLAQVPAPGQERYATGGDSAGAPGTFRSRFRATAYWNPSILTDAAGQARVSFDAPDNLTAFRLMAVAADDGDRFGSGDKRFAVNKPLQILSALPRFASVGDQFAAAVMLTNETGKAGTAKVTLTATGVTADGGGTSAASLERSVPLEKGGRARVEFPVVAGTPGDARFRFAAVMADENDGLEITLPVHYPTAQESTLVSEGHTDKSVKLPLVLPAGVLPGSANLTISVDPDGLAGIEESLRALVEYPYGCLEQTTSRLIPLIAVQELTRHMGLPEFEGEKLQRFIRIAVAKIFRHQTGSGGFSLWPGSEPETYLTAFALWGLKLSLDAGHAVDQSAVQEGIAYLRRELAGKPREDDHHNLFGELGGRAFALYVLSLYGHAEPGFATAMLEKADTLPRFGVAFLSRALAVAVGPSHASVAGLLDKLKTAISPRGTDDATLIPERTDADLSSYYSTNLRTSAIVADALLSLRPDDPEIPRLVRGLLAERRAAGSWYTTQDNLYALVALTNYARARAGKEASVTITRGGGPLLTERLSGKGTKRVRQLSLSVDGKDPSPISITATQGTVHYRVRLSYRLDRAHQPALEKGIAIKRVFLNPETGAPLDKVTLGEMVRVELTLSSGEYRHHVALSDYLPAGLEPINTRFATVPRNLPDDANQDGNDWYRKLWVNHRELGEQRVDAFVDWMPARPATFEYLVRATTAGTFVVPSATALEMYDPDVRGRTALRTLQVVVK